MKKNNDNEKAQHIKNIDVNIILCLYQNTEDK